MATPDRVGEALTARLLGLTGDRTTLARPAAILDQGDDEVGAHGWFLPRGCESAWWTDFAVVVAECATVSGRGYYAIEPALDVLRRPSRHEGVLARPPEGVNAKQHRAPLLACRNAGGPAKQDGNSMNSRS